MTIASLFEALGAPLRSSAHGLLVHAPHSREALCQLAVDDAGSLATKITHAQAAQQAFAALPRHVREALLRDYSAELKRERERVAEILHLESGKSRKEAQGETDGAIDLPAKTIAEATLADLGNMRRIKERPGVGVVGLITSFNFPIAVAHWTLAPALLAGNAVVWKPSEKTPLTALACKAIFDRVAGPHRALFEVAIGAREVGEALVAHEAVAMISATGSVAMGEGIKRLLAARKGPYAPPILELGGNNGMIFSEHMDAAHVEWALGALMNSFLGTTGQRCTNTRRLMVHRSQMARVVATLSAMVEKLMAGELAQPENAYGYGPLIDEDAFQRFEKGKAQARAEGGEILFGARLAQPHEKAYFVQPALAVMPDHGPVMHQEIFAPLLFIAPYDGGIDEACALLNAPENAGLVGAIYTQSQREAERFAQLCEAGHVLINPPKGTGTPAHGMGFGGNKHSGSGEILNTLDPLAAFTRRDHFRRIAINKDITMAE